MMNRAEVVGLLPERPARQRTPSATEALTICLRDTYCGPEVLLRDMKFVDDDDDDAGEMTKENILKSLTSTLRTRSTHVMS